MDAHRVSAGAWRRHSPRVCALTAGLLLAGAVPAAPTVIAAAAPPAEADVGLVIGGTTLDARDFEEALQIVRQRRYFHGNVPPEALAQLRSEAREALIDRTLLLNEARRRALRVDAAAAEAPLAGLEQRYRGTKDWAARRERLRRRLRDDALIDALYEQERRGVGVPTSAQLREYYDTHRPQFTEPQKQRVAVILLAVEASAPKVKWDAARAEALGIVRQLRAGAEFGALARLRSSDASAGRGGDMGYLHRGMLPEEAQQAVDRLAPGEVTEPVTLLSGVAVFRLDARQAEKLLPSSAVTDRARELWVRDAQDRRAQELIRGLRAAAVIRVAGNARSAGT